MRRTNVVPSSDLARRPNKIKASTETVHVSFLLDADLAREVDEEAARRSEIDPDRRRWTRTDTLKALLRAALAALPKPPQ